MKVGAVTSTIIILLIAELQTSTLEVNRAKAPFVLLKNNNKTPRDEYLKQVLHIVASVR